ncbi:hypothetical protein PR048_031775 [Dryococelus australis]|uniref:Uncharacterized protein n=1 Tax=Dryococelus australis TaxID=614101 RepID=A0ABQ9G6A4_9NEOP|nr:hypothetical protein PR048_031775 [Dryococelus australis]
MQGVRETGDPRVNRLTSGNVRNDSHMRKSRSDPPGIEPGSAGWNAPYGHDILHLYKRPPLLTNAFCEKRIFSTQRCSWYITNHSAATRQPSANTLQEDLATTTGQQSSTPDMHRKREIPEKTRRPAASSGTIPKRANLGATTPEIAPGPPRWEASCLTTRLPRTPPTWKVLFRIVVMVPEIRPTE